MIDEEKNTFEPVDNKTEEKEELTKTQIINLEKIKCPDIDIEKEPDGFNCSEEVENKRKAIFAKYKKNRTVSNILMVVAVALIVGAFVLIVQTDQACKIAGYVMGACTLVGLLTYYIFSKNKFPNATKEYIKEVSLIMNRHVFNDDRFKNMVTNPNTKIELTDLVADRVYANPTDIGSRNVCEGHFIKSKIKVAEVALYRQQNRKQRDVCFVGKYLSLDNNIKMDGRAIITIKGEKNLDLPTDIEDLKLVKEEGNFLVYGAEGFELSSILSSKVISGIKKIQTKDNLLNINICIWGGHTAVYLSYDDPVVSLPFDKEFQYSALEQYRKNLIDILEVLAEK